MLPGSNRFVFWCLRKMFGPEGQVNEAVAADAKWLNWELWGRLWPAFGWKVSREVRLSGEGMFSTSKGMKRVISRIYQN
jgi:hypothetical protein